MKIIDIDSIFGSWPRKELRVTPGNLLDNMKACGIAKSAALSAKGMFYSHNEGNKETLAVCSKHPELLPVATINPREMTPKERLPQKLKKEGFKLIRFFPEIQHWPYEYSPFMDLLDDIEYCGLPVMIASTSIGAPTAMLRVFGKRKIKVIVSNTGYALLAEMLSVMQRNKNICIVTKLHNSPDGITQLVKNCGADRVFFGSGQPHDHIGNSLQMIRSADLAEKEKERILSANAKALFKI